MAWHDFCRAAFVAGLACLATCGLSIIAASATDAAGPEVAGCQAWRQQIAELEARLFDPLLAPTEVDRLLAELEHAETRSEAARWLGQQGQGHIDRVIAFARQCPDLEARQACVEIVEALDASYRTTELGKQLGALYHEHANALLPAYWARFRNDPLDLRAVAMLMHADPDAAYAALGRTGDRHDRLRYLLLRIRELSPDEFAQRYIFEYSAPAVLLAMPNVFPHAVDGDRLRITRRAHRMVGHTWVAVFFCPTDSFDKASRESPAGPKLTPDGLPTLQEVHFTRRWVYTFRFSGRPDGAFRLKIGAYRYFSDKVHETAIHSGYGRYAEGPGLLPELVLSREQAEALASRTPWWVESYFPTVYRGRVPVAQPKPGQETPQPVEIGEEPTEEVHEAEPAAATEGPEATAARRHQAEAELLAARAIHREEPGTRDPQKLLARLGHAEKAVKLDPASEKAAHEHVVALKDWCYQTLGAFRPDLVPDRAEQVFIHALRYFGQFDSEPSRREDIHDACRIAIHLALGDLYFGRSLDLTPQRLRMIRSAKHVLDDSVEYGCSGLSEDYQAMILTIVGRAMIRTGVPVDERQCWIDSILERCSRLESRARHRNGFNARSTRQQSHRLWLGAAVLALEDGSIGRARRLVAELQDRLVVKYESPHSSIFPGIRNVLVQMDAAAAVNAYDRWIEELHANVVGLVHIPCPPVNVFRDGEPNGSQVTRTMPPVGGTRLRHPPLADDSPRTPIAALVEGDGRLYVAMHSHHPIHWDHFEGRSPLAFQVLGYLPLDAAGKPAGHTSRDEHGENDSGNEFSLLPQPAIARALQVCTAEYLDGKLYLGTAYDGILVFDPESHAWSSLGPEKGLPSRGVVAIHPLDEATLFCVGHSSGDHWEVYTLELPEGRVTHRYRANKIGRDYTPRLFWRDGEALRAWSRQGLYENVLARNVRLLGDDDLTTNGPFTPRSCEVPYGWKHPHGKLDSDVPKGFISFAEVGGRRFVTNAGLHEFDAGGKILHSWWAETLYESRHDPVFRMSLPPDCPIQSQYMVAAGNLLVFIDENSVLAWDPKADTWYGPLAVHGAVHGLGARTGVWLGTDDGLIFLSTDNLVATAKSVGRALTTEQYRRRQQEVIAAMPPLDRAKVAYSMRQLDQAKELAQTVLEDDPDCAEALLLMGSLHDAWCMNRPQAALEYYGRLAKIETDPDTSFTGMYRRLVLLRTEKRWPEAMAVIEEIDAASFRLHDNHERQIDWWRNHIQKQLAETDAKQPADETSNKEERPGN